MPAISKVRKPTKEDVAKEAGVSHMTVSRVFRGQSGVGEQTRERVLTVARQLGYRPNHVARSLAQARTQTLGLVLYSNLWFADVLTGAEETAQQLGYAFIQTSARVEAQIEQERIETLRERQVDGLLLLSSSDARQHQHLLEWHQSGVPLVTINRYCEPMGFWRLFFDFRGSTQAITRRFLTVGHRQVLFVGGTPEHAQATVRERVAGYREALEEAGLTPGDTEVFGGTEVYDGEALMAEALRRCPAATAMVTVNDLVAAGALHHLRRAGRRVPEDMAVISLHGTEIGPCTDPRLSAIHHSTWEAGREGCRLLIEQIEQPDRPTGTLILPSTLVVRQSCGFGGESAEEQRLSLL